VERRGKTRGENKKKQDKSKYWDGEKYKSLDKKLIKKEEKNWGGMGNKSVGVRVKPRGGAHKKSGGSMILRGEK